MWTPEDAYGKGPFEIWYLPPYRPKGHGHDYSHPSMRAGLGTEFRAFKQNPVTIEEVQDAYARLGSIAARSLEDVYLKMQGENWGKGSKTNEFLRKAGTTHTSMMMGDVVHHDGKWWIVDTAGFTDIGHRSEPAVPTIRRE